MRPEEVREALDRLGQREVRQLAPVPPGPAPYVPVNPCTPFPGTYPWPTYPGTGWDPLQPIWVVTSAHASTRTRTFSSDKIELNGN